MYRIVSLFSGGMWTFNIIPNSAVHVVMYTYYFVTSLGPESQKRIAPFKPYVTRLQLVNIANENKVLYNFI